MVLQIKKLETSIIFSLCPDLDLNAPTPLFDFASGLRVPEPPPVHAAPEERQVPAAAPDVAREGVRGAGLPLRLGVRAAQALLLQRLHLRLPGVRPAATGSAAA